MDTLFGYRFAILLVPTSIVLFSRSVDALDGVLVPPAARRDWASYLQPLKSIFPRFLFDLRRGSGPFADPPTWFLVSMGITAVCGIGSVAYLLGRRSKRRLGSMAEEKPNTFHNDDSMAEPGLFQKHSTIRQYHVPNTGFTYPEIRTFYVPHHQMSKLPQKPYPIPLLVFVHGLGGSCVQFHSVLKSLVDIAPCLAIDLPGCGQSSMRPRNWKAYSTDALVELLAVVIETYRDRAAGQGVVLLSHSYGTSLAALLASSTSPHAKLISDHVLGLVAICPALPPDEAHTKAAKTACNTPAPIFDLFRRYDRRGGINSVSVARMAGKDGDIATKTLQLYYNEHSRTPVWQRMMYGAITNPSTGNFPGEAIWSGLKLPVLLIGAEADTVTPVANLKSIVQYLGHDPSTVDTTNEKILSEALAPSPVPSPAVLSEQNTEPTLSSTSSSETSLDPDSKPTSAPTPTAPPAAPNPRALCLKTIVFPAPAAHSLVFSPGPSRILSALISKFLTAHIDPRLSAAWQLHYLNKEGKWDVKNLEKWTAVAPVSAPIAGLFRAMKTLREVDVRHTPKQFVQEWSTAAKGVYGVRAVLDISRECPVYNPKGLEEGSVRYYKLPTVSKLPPTGKEVEEFVALVDRVREELGLDKEKGEPGLVGVHCHYGFNRTGFFLVCYMVERLGYSVEDAIEEFRLKRGPGIKHSHFVDALHVRYYKGLKRAPTL